MDRKKFIPLSLLLSSAMFVFWACGEGDIIGVDDKDETVLKKFEEELDSTKKDYAKKAEKFLEPFLEYCNSKEGHKNGCNADIMKMSSSSKNGGDNSASSKSSSSTSGKNSSSSSAGSSSSKGGSSSSGTVSSSSKKTDSSSSTASSSSAALKVSGTCIVSKGTVYIGEEVTWEYVPDEGSLLTANFVWEPSNEVENAIVEGKLSGNGVPKLTVKFSKKGFKASPDLTFGGTIFDDCPGVEVLEKNAPQSSSSEAESSSSEEESSSSVSSSSVKGYCAVSKRKIFVGETVDWYIVNADGEELVGKHKWIDLGDETAELVDGEDNGTGSTRITVKYTRTKPAVVAMATFGTQTIDCERNELDDNDEDALLEVMAEQVSSSSEEAPPEESSSSSSDEEEKSSSSKALDPCGEDPESCIF